MSSCPLVSNAPTTSNDDLARLQRDIGYVFSDAALLRRALTHKSHSKQNNERLEYIGDAVLGYLIAVALYRHKRDMREDAMSLMRANLVRGTSLADVARQLGMAELLLLGSGEKKSGGRSRSSILADAFEALVGAIHEDGGITACAAVVDKLFKQRIEELDPEELKDAKTKLQEHLQATGLALPTYSISEVSGEDHKRTYTVRCEVESLKLVSEASASSRRKAEKAAADAMLAQLAKPKVNTRDNGYD